MCLPARANEQAPRHGVDIFRLSYLQLSVGDGYGRVLSARVPKNARPPAEEMAIHLDGGRHVAGLHVLDPAPHLRVQPGQRVEGTAG